MSQWTHVSGCIRIDGTCISSIDKTLQNKIEDAFGSTVSYEDPEVDWLNCKAPLGSEGSIQYGVVRTGDEGSMSWGLIYIWGDLRDYYEFDKIYFWIKEACKDLYIRSCSVKVDVEGAGTYFIYDEYDLVNYKTEILLKEIVK